MLEVKLVGRDGKRFWERLHEDAPVAIRSAWQSDYTGDERRSIGELILTLRHSIAARGGSGLRLRCMRNKKLSTPSPKLAACEGTFSRPSLRQLGEHIKQDRSPRSKSK
jgi:hypothetical protein